MNSTANEKIGSRAPIVDYKTDDIEPKEAVERGGENA